MERTQRAAIYSGIFLHDGRKPISVIGWATTPGPVIIGSQLKEFALTDVLEKEGDLRRDRMRLVEFGWTEIEPVRYPVIEEELES
jgi:hypothetical protein